MSSYQARITASFLRHCSPREIYEWLSASQISLEEFKDSFEKIECDQTILERLLLRRRHPLIDLGLAQFGSAPRTLRTVFARGDKGVRCAVLANPFLFRSKQPAVGLDEITNRGDRQEIEALALNAHLSDFCYSSMINRTESFSELDEHNYKFLLSRLGENPRLATPSDDGYLDGSHEYVHHLKVFTDAWKLTITVPATQEWAYTLCRLLSRAEPPMGIESLEQIIERWRIDRDPDYDSDYAFQLRSRLADLLDANEQLLKSTDLALRRSFYRRFRPWLFEDWCSYLAKDGDDFLQEIIVNLNIWRSRDDREKLKKITWSIPDSDLVNDYLAYEKSCIEKYPEWFRDLGSRRNVCQCAARQRARSASTSISEKVDALVAKRGQPFKKWLR